MNKLIRIFCYAYMTIYVLICLIGFAADHQWF